MLGEQLGSGKLRLVALIVLGLAVVVGFWNSAAVAAEQTPATQSLDELLNKQPSSSWRSDAPASYEARQITSEARLAEQMTDHSQSANDAEIVGATVPTKKLHLHPAMIGLLAFGGLLVLTAVALLVWSRIVQQREMRDAPSPMAFNHS